MVSVGKIVLTIENGLAAQRSVLLASLEVVEKGLEAATAQLANVNEGPAAGRARKLQTMQPYIRFATKERDDALAALKAFQEQQFEFEGLRNEDVSMIVTHGCSLLWLGAVSPL
jgi:recombinational DNA repair ATPase RecF